MLLKNDYLCAEPDERYQIDYSQGDLNLSGPVYWPVYSREKNRKRRFHKIQCSCNRLCLTILTQQEWQLILQRYLPPESVNKNDHQMIIDLLGRKGFKAVMKMFGSEIFLVIFGSSEQLKKMHIRPFISQQLRIGIGALSTDWGITTSVHVIAMMDVIVAGAICNIHYILNDEQIFIAGGVTEALIFADAISVVSTLLAVDEYFPVNKTVGLGLMLVSVSLPVNQADSIQEEFSFQMIKYASYLLDKY